MISVLMVEFLYFYFNYLFLVTTVSFPREGSGICASCKEETGFALVGGEGEAMKPQSWVPPVARLLLSSS